MPEVMKIGAHLRNVAPVYLGGGQAPVIFTHVGITGEGEMLDRAISAEREKIRCAIAMGSDIICDVSLHPNIGYIQTKLLDGLEVPFASVPIYETYIRSEKNNLALSDQTFLDIIKAQIDRGVDILTLHATVMRGDRDVMAGSGRLIPTTSRGGVLMLELLEANNCENPYYQHFDAILDLCREHGIALSLGPTYRPASVVDGYAGDALHQMELKRMADLVVRAHNAGVGVMIEGIGHAALDKIPGLISLARKLCGDVPYRIMSVSTDIAAGYDHISSAIASAVAVQYGADSITCVTRSEHIGIPSCDEVIEAVIAARIAAHSGYMARTGDMSRDKAVSRLRTERGCGGAASVVLFPNSNMLGEFSGSQSCTMCGGYCPLEKMFY